MATTVEIDGSMLEGGGQILRNAFGLSGLLGIPIRVSKIRAGRKQPGLRPQHLKGIELIAALCDGSELQGAAVNSTAVSFKPGSPQGGSFTVDTETAGSTGLLFQVALPLMVCCPSPAVHLQLIGGTDAKFAPPIDYVVEVLLPYIKHFIPLGPSPSGSAAAVLDLAVQVQRRGFYPKGQGTVTTHAKRTAAGTESYQLNPVEITEFGQLKCIRGRAFVSQLAGHIAHRMVQSCRTVLGQYLAKELGLGSVGVDACFADEDHLDASPAHADAGPVCYKCGQPGHKARKCNGKGRKWNKRGGGGKRGRGNPHPASQAPQITYTGGIPITIDVVVESKTSAFGVGSGITIWAETTTGCLLGASSLAERGVSAEDVGRTCAEALIADLRHEACLDTHLQDQLIVLMALAKGTSRVRTGPLTMHTRTAMAIMELLTKGQAKFKTTALRPGTGGSTALAMDQGTGGAIVGESGAVDSMQAASKHAEDAEDGWEGPILIECEGLGLTVPAVHAPGE